MQVLGSKKIDNGYSIEWGNSTWDARERSIRNRYEPFSPHSSSELPIGDLEHLIVAACEWKLLSRETIIVMLKSLVDTL